MKIYFGIFRILFYFLEFFLVLAELLKKTVRAPDWAEGPAEPGQARAAAVSRTGSGPESRAKPPCPARTPRRVRLGLLSESKAATACPGGRRWRGEMGRHGWVSAQPAEPLLKKTILPKLRKILENKMKF